MNQKDHNSLIHLFDRMDLNHDKKLSRDEFITGMLSINHLDVTDIEVKRMFDSIDVDNKGYITGPEFLKVRKVHFLSIFDNYCCFLFV